MDNKQKILEILKNIGKWNSGFELILTNTAKTVIENKELISRIAKTIDKYKVILEDNNDSKEKGEENKEENKEKEDNDKKDDNKECDNNKNNKEKEDSIDNDEVIYKLNLNKLKFTTEYNNIEYTVTFSEDSIVNGEEVKGGIIMEYDLEENGIKKHYTSEKIEYDFNVVEPIVLGILNCGKNSNLLKMNKNNLCIIDILLRNIKSEDKQRLLNAFIDEIGRSKKLNSETKKFLLKRACQGGNIELFKYFFEKFPDEFYNIKNELMYHAFLGKNPGIIHILEEEGCKVDYNALKGACESGDVGLVEYIINNNDVHEIMSKNYTIHNRLFIRSFPKVFQFNFETEIINLFNFINNPYIALCLIEKYDFIKNNKKYKRKLLGQAIYSGNLSVIEFLISNLEIDINEEVELFSEHLTPLGIAIEKKNKEVTKLLLSNPNLDINKKFKSSYLCSPLFAAILNKLDSEVIELFLSNPNLDVNAEFYCKKGDPMTLIACAIEQNNLKVLELLYNHPEISSKIDINRKFTYLRNEEITLSTFSIWQGGLEIFEFLISKGNINLAEKNEQNKKMLFDSIRLRDFRIFKFLYQYQANFIDAEYVNNPEEKLTPIAIAMRCYNFRVADFLLKNKKIDLDVKYKYIDYSKREKTLLEFAIYRGINNENQIYKEEYNDMIVTLFKKSKIEEIKKEKEEIKKLAKSNDDLKEKLISCLQQENYFGEEITNTLAEILKEIDTEKNVHLNGK